MRAFVAGFVLALGLLHGDPEPARLGLQTRRQTDDLQQWLEQLELHIPGNITVGPVLGENLVVSKLVCGKITMEHLSGTTDASQATLAYALNGVGLTCDADYALVRASKGLQATDNGDHVSLEIAHLDAGLTLAFEGAPGPPTSMSMPACQITAPKDSFSIKFTGGIAPAILNLFQPLIDGAVETLLSKDVCPLLAKQVAKVNFTALDKALDEWTTTPEPAVFPAPSQDTRDMNDVQLFGVVVAVVNDTIANLNGTVGLNRLLAQLDGHPATLSPPANTTLVTSVGNATFAVQSATISGISDVQDAHLLTVSSNETLGVNMRLGHMEVALRMSVLVTPATGDLLEEHFVVQANVSSVMFHTDLHMDLRNGSRKDTINQWLNANCEWQAFHSLGLQVMDLNVSQPSLGVVNDQETGLSAELSETLGATVGLVTGVWGGLITEALEGALGGPLRDSLNQALATGMAGAGPCKPDHSLTDTVSPATSNFAGTSFVAMAVLGFVALAFAAAVAARSHRRAKGQPAPPPEGPADPARDFLAVVGRLPRPTLLEGALCTHPAMHPALFYAIPVLLLANCCGFISSNSGVGVQILVELRGKGATPEFLPDIFDFGLIGTVRDMFRSGVYALGTFVALFSCLWPYTKITMMGACWLVPEKRLSLRARGGLLRFLDAFGKWSLLDAFVLVLMMVAFNFRLAGQNDGVYVWVVPLWGFQSLVLSTILSMCLGHFLCALNRKAHKHDMGVTAEEQEDARWVSVMRRRELPMWRQVFPIVCLVASLGIFLWGINVNAYGFKFGGLAGGVVGGPKYYSVWSMIATFPSKARNPDDFGIRFIQYIFTVFSIGMVVLEQVTLLLLWVLPMAQKVQRRVFVAWQIFNAWACTDVLVFSLFVGSFQIKTFAGFIVGTKCDRLKNVVAEAGYDSCFSVDMVLAPGIGVLLGSVVLTVVASCVVGGECAKAFGERGGRESEVEAGPTVLEGGLGQTEEGATA